MSIKVLNKENRKLLEALEIVQDAVTKILEEETDPERGCGLNSSIELVTITVCSYVLFRGIGVEDMREIADGILEL
jgi:hypothetical protein|tara:strand:+ start:11679 stop:11906 length:228 start_codon:yes stop_codon:yes gene_type:complete